MLMFSDSVEDKAQADGAQTVTLGAADRFSRHQVQVEVSDAPTAGTLDVSVRTPGASEFKSIYTMDLTDATDLLTQWDGFADAFRFTPSNFDADKTYSVFLVSGVAS